MARHLIKGLFLILAPIALSAQAPATAPGGGDPQALLAVAEKVNGLEGEGLKPWHLKANYATFDKAGDISGTGVFEEWHADAAHWKRTYTSAKFTQTEYQTAQGHFYESDAGAAPWPESLIVEKLVDPMPCTLDKTDTVPELRERVFGESRMNCVMLSPRENHAAWPLGLFPTYCFGQNEPVLRLSVFNDSVEAEFNGIVSFEGRYVPKSAAFIDEGRQLLHVWLTALEVIPQDGANLPVILSGGKKTDKQEVRLQPQLFKDHMLRAKEKLPEGFVMLFVEIGSDGHVRGVRVMKSTDPALSIAAISAAEKHDFGHYKSNDAPVNAHEVVSYVFTSQN
jgi:hypothetical protein